MKSNVFDERAQEYDAWFDEYPSVYQSELAALRKVMPKGEGLEVGVGTGRFASPLGIRCGLDPSVPMLSIAQERDVDLVRGVAEALPFRNGSFDFVLFVTTLCFVSDPLKALAEAKRVNKRHGRIVVGLIDKDSLLGSDYVRKTKGGGFYRDATFLSTNKLLAMLKEIDCTLQATFQTVFRDPGDMATPDPVLPGQGKGLFVVISAKWNSK